LAAGVQTKEEKVRSGRDTVECGGVYKGWPRKGINVSRQDVVCPPSKEVSHLARKMKVVVLAARPRNDRKIGGTQGEDWIDGKHVYKRIKRGGEPPVKYKDPTTQCE